MFDYLVAGAGFAGAVVASQMARTFDQRVILVDRRPHVGGNAYDHYDQSGILVHKYGPHIFHTNSRDVFAYLSKFTSWRNYQHKVLASVDGRLVPIPINLDTVNALHGLTLTETELEEYLNRIAEKPAAIRTSEDVVVSRVGRDLYEKLFRGYTRKQWGLDPSQLDSSVTARIPVRFNRDDHYFSDTYQAMPRHGFTRMFENMLDHPNITLALGTDYRDLVKSVRYRELVYTGPIDEFFDYRFGKLPYRSLRFRHETVDAAQVQPVAVINHPNEHDYTRVTEFKHLTGQVSARSSIVYEFPCDDGDPYYPIPRPENAALYKRYEALGAQTKGVHFTGRLATYKYYNMDQVVAQALTLCTKLAGVTREQLIRETSGPEILTVPGRLIPATS
ncbi:MAG TPA: UDP-galactopyranose mutase [Bryobacteraceae bacterium]|nr:UDP-galactopyranose mutase [Bryobacteraceae bacterium]